MTVPAHSERIAAIEARLKAATPGPWQRVLDSTSENTVRAHSGGAVGGVVASLYMKWIHDDAQAEQRSNAELIANAPSDLRFLLDENARLREAASRTLAIIDTYWGCTALPAYLKHARNVLAGHPQESTE